MDAIDFNRLTAKMIHLKQILLSFIPNSKWKYFSILSNFLLFLGLVLYMNALFISLPDMSILYAPIFGGLIIYLIVIILDSYFLTVLRYPVWYILCGLFLGMSSVSFGLNHIVQSTTLDVANVFLISSIVAKIISDIAFRILGYYHIPGCMFLMEEFCLWLGYSISFFYTEERYSLLLLNIALLANQICLRQRSLLGMFSLIGFSLLIVLHLFPVHLPQIKFAPFPTIVFLSRIVFQPFLDFLLSSSSLEERWYQFIRQSRFSQFIFLMSLIILEFSYLIVSALWIPTHQEWFIVTPIFIIFAFLWLCLHFAFFVMCRQLMNKFHICKKTHMSLGQGNTGMLQILASKGVRHFALLSNRIIVFNLISTLLMGLITWETHRPVNLSLFLIIVPVEILLCSLFLEMGSRLGGTCLGYVIISPTTNSKYVVFSGQHDNKSWDSLLNCESILRYRNNIDGLTILPAEIDQDLASNCTQTMGRVQSFFRERMIDNFGCDYSSSGLSVDSVQVKLKTFFQKCMQDGPRYDTYILYYSGPTLPNGDWALGEAFSYGKYPDSNILKISSLLELWQSCLERHCRSSRLILMLDGPHSYNWVPTVKSYGDSCVAIQTCVYINSSNVCQFTRDWILWNSKVRSQSPADASLVNWRDKSSPIKALYGVSRCWTDFQFHLPSVEEFQNHWSMSIPRIVQPIIKLVNLVDFTSKCSLFGSFGRCLRRKKMRYLPPFELDTGHGFRLVRSPK